MKPFLFSILVLMAAPSSIQSMEAVQKYASKSCAQIILQKTMSQLDKAISILPIWVYAAYKNYNLTSDMISRPDASPEVVQFTKEELKRQGFADWEKISIKKGKRFAALHNPFIYAIEVENDRMQLALKNPNFCDHYKQGITINYDSPAYLTAVRAILGHERGHLESFDVIRKNIAAFAIPLSIHYSFNKLPFNLVQNVNAKALLKMPLAFSKLMMSYYLIQAYIRHREWAADEAIPNEPDLLLATASDFEARDYVNKEIKKISDSESSAFKNVCNNFEQKYFDTHPTHQGRIQRLKERAKQLQNSK